MAKKFISFTTSNNEYLVVDADSITGLKERSKNYTIVYCKSMEPFTIFKTVQQVWEKLEDLLDGELIDFGKE